MPRAIVDPDELRRFKVFLGSMSVSIRHRKSSLNSSFNNLKDHWRDEKYRQFDKLFSETMGQLDQFCKSADLFVHHLNEKEKPIRRYQEHRY